jgi:lysophospholipase L1-like esterase
MQHVLQAASSGFGELRGNLTKTENATGPYPLFRLRKIYEGAFIFGGAYAAQLEEVYYSDANQPAYNYHLYFQDSSDKGPRYNDLRGRLDVMLRDFVHTSGTGYDAWAGSDARGTAVLLTDRDVLRSVEVKVHVAFPKPQW